MPIQLMHLIIVSSILLYLLIYLLRKELQYEQNKQYT